MPAIQQWFYMSTIKSTITNFMFLFGPIIFLRQQWHVKNRYFFLISQKTQVEVYVITKIILYWISNKISIYFSPWNWLFFLHTKYFLVILCMYSIHYKIILKHKYTKCTNTSCPPLTLNRSISWIHSIKKNIISITRTIKISI